MTLTRPASVLVAWASLAAGGLAAQEPPPPDTVVVPDSLQAQTPDSLQTPGDTLMQVADSLMQAADSVMPVDTFPGFPSRTPAGYGQAVWEWDRDDLLSTRGFTLAELLSLAPGVTLIRSGDYGSPNTVVAFGAAGGGLQVFWDGFELWSMDGGTPDLSRIGLAGLDRVRLERGMGGLRVEIFTLQPLEPEPFTEVDVGTGDLRTNLLRATFAHPKTLGGALTFALDRLDTRGPALEEVGSVSGVTLRYGIHAGNRGGLVGELRRYSPEIDLAALGEAKDRSDLLLRGRWRFGEALTVDGFYGTSSLSGPEVQEDEVAFDESRRQIGVRAALDRGPLWGRVAGRLPGGDGLPDWSAEATVGQSWPGRGSLDVGWRQDSWDGEGTSVVRAGARTEAFYGLSLFGSYEDGTVGVPYVLAFHDFEVAKQVMDTTTMPMPEEPPLVEPEVRVSERTGIRVGGSYEWRGIRVSGAWLSLEVDSVYPLGLELDRDGVTVEGGKRTGYEIGVHLPFLWDGLSLDGAYQAWDEDLTYMPKATWNASLKYHNVFKETGNLELWTDLGVTQRDAMSLPLTETPEGATEPVLIRAPVYKEWYLMVQVRIVSVRVFVRFENLGNKRDNFDFPDRAQPVARAMYGVRWILFN